MTHRFPRKTAIVISLISITILLLVAIYGNRRAKNVENTRTMITIADSLVTEHLAVIFRIRSNADRSQTRILAFPQETLARNIFDGINTTQGFRVFVAYNDKTQNNAPVVFYECKSATKITQIELKEGNPYPMLVVTTPIETVSYSVKRLVTVEDSITALSAHEESYTYLADDDIEPKELNFFASGKYYVGWTAEVINSTGGSIKAEITDFDRRYTKPVASPGNLLRGYTLRLLKNQKEVARYKLKRTSPDETLDFSFGIGCSNAPAGTPQVYIWSSARYWWPEGIKVGPAKIGGCEPNDQKPWYEQ